ERTAEQNPLPSLPLGFSPVVEPSESQELRVSPMTSNAKGLSRPTSDNVFARIHAAFVKALERKTGEDLEQMRSEPLGDRRLRTEEKLGRPWHFKSEFPYIGRGSVLNDK